MSSDLTRKDLRRLALYEAALILDGVTVSGDWGPPDLVAQFGPEAVDEIKEEISKISSEMKNRGWTREEIKNGGKAW